MSAWKWWASDDEERYTIGPCDTRDEVIKEAIDSELGAWGTGNHDDPHRCTFYITEAKHDPIDLSKHLNLDLMIDHMCESLDEEHGDPDGYTQPSEQLKPEDMADLKISIESAVKRWQERRCIKINPFMFSDCRNREQIEHVYPQEQAA